MSSQINKLSDEIPNLSQIQLTKARESFICYSCRKIKPTGTMFLKVAGICYSCAIGWYEQSIKKFDNLKIYMKRKIKEIEANKEEWYKLEVASAL